MLITTFLVIAAVICAFRAVRSRHLLSSAIWLASTSAVIATLMFRLGAEQIAVVELSVGAGLVTVLFVFAISIAGDEGLSEREFLPSTLTISAVALFLLLLGGMVLPIDSLDTTTNNVPFTEIFWNDRALDVLIQLVLIFTGVLCLLGLLADAPEPPQQTAGEFPRAHIMSTLDIIDERITAGETLKPKSGHPADAPQNTDPNADETTATKELAV